MGMETMSVNNGEPKKIEAGVGEHLDLYVQRIAQAALESDVMMNFNNVESTVVKGVYNSDDIMAIWRKSIEERYEKNRNSPEGKITAQEEEEDIKKNQENIDKLINQLDTLDFSNVEKVLGWCAEFGYSVVGTDTNKRKILNKLAENGYFPKVNIGPEFKGEDKENYARFLIGQFLSGIKINGRNYQVFGKFYDEWKEKFVK